MIKIVKVVREYGGLGNIAAKTVKWLYYAMQLEIYLRKFWISWSWVYIFTQFFNGVLWLYSSTT